MIKKQIIVIGAGLAGSEAAWQVANSGVPVKLVEMRPFKSTPAHHTDECGELVEELSQIEEISNYRFNENEIERILTSVIHKFSPHGIGYRNYKECIRIQIDNKKKLSFNAIFLAFEISFLLFNKIFFLFL